MDGAIGMIGCHIFVAEIKKQIMWIAILITAVLYAIFRKKKKENNNVKSYILIFIITASSLSFAKAQPPSYKIHRKIRVPKLKGELYIFLVDKETFSTPFSGVDTIICNLDTGITTFRFNNVLPGEYAIRCFQDLNNNNKLDKRFFMPSEPWGFSWKNEKTIPFSFKEVSFLVKRILISNYILIT